MKRNKKLVISILATAILAAVPFQALASDHLFNAATSSGALVRGFAGPVAFNPSGVSGPAAQPGTVPGEGDPNSGGDTGTPSVDCGLLNPNSDPAFCN